MCGWIFFFIPLCKFDLCFTPNLNVSSHVSWLNGVIVFVCTTVKAWCLDEYECSDCGDLPQSSSTVRLCCLDLSKLHQPWLVVIKLFNMLCIYLYFTFNLIFVSTYVVLSCCEH